MQQAERRSLIRLKKAVLYLRVSTASKSRYGDVLTFDQRPELQQEPLERLAEQRGWQVVNVYTDRISGAKERRPALEQLINDATRGKFDVVMVWRFDRLSRSLIHFLQTVEELRELNVDFVSHEQSFDTTTPMGRFCLTMFGALAELERAVIRDRVIAGLEYARTRGTKSGKPIGRPKVIFDRAKVPDLRRQGLSWREIAKSLGVGVGTVRRVCKNFQNSTLSCQNPIPEALE